MSNTCYEFNKWKEIIEGVYYLQALKQEAQKKPTIEWDIILSLLTKRNNSIRKKNTSTFYALLLE